MELICSGDHEGTIADIYDLRGLCLLSFHDICVNVGFRCTPAKMNFPQPSNDTQPSS